ncbi:MAG: NAD(+)/NADH kinase [Verrucomicrobiales bacterium]|nr:NAD(+)/NADH kinase [Verrucomicrobiales bacterium]
MAPKSPRIGLIANPDKRGSDDLLAQLWKEFGDLNVIPVLDQSTAAQFDDPNLEGLPIQDVAENTDLILILGGDGTLLWVLRHLGAAVRPLAAINTGTLGFLTCGTAEDAGDLVQRLVSGDFEISRRSIIRARLVNESGSGEQEEFHALNEISVVRGSNSRVVHIEARINGTPMNHYTGDGLIVATPTGSTAYSLSAGGPIAAPDAEVFAITPICPHALTNRPIVVSDQARIDLEIPDQRDQLLMMVDGQRVARMDRSATIQIRRATFDLPLITLPGSTFYGVLHQKLGWSGSAIASNGKRKK